jgi:putative PEP-CTERM system histidine kinase
VKVVAATLNGFGAFSYSLAALAFLVLTGLLLVSWKGRPAGAFLTLATLITACWSVLLAVQSATGGLPVLALYAAELLQDAGWIIALLVIAGSSVSGKLKVIVMLACGLLCITAPAAWLLERAALVYVEPTLLLSRTQMVTSLAGLIVIEQIYRNSTHSGRYSIKFFAIGVGAIFAYDLFLYSQVELVGRLSAHAWSARGLIVAGSVPLIALSAQRTRDWSLNVFVSRHVVFYSSTLLVVGAYLVVTLLGGYYVREIGGVWGRVGQVVFLTGATIALVSVLASGSVRRHAIVFIGKHFYRNKYDYRVEWLRFVRTLSSPEEPDVRHTALRAIAQIFSSPRGLLFLYDEQRLNFVPVAAWPSDSNAVERAQSLPAAGDLPQFLKRTNWIIDLRELRESPDTYGNIDTPEWLNGTRDLRIVAPLMQLDEVVGFVCLSDPPPPFELTYEDRDLLKTVGRHVATHIAQQDASRKLAESRQFEAYNRLTAFMMHDLKNSVAQLKLIVENSTRHKRNPEFIDDVITTISNTVERMSRLIEQLRSSKELERIDVVDLTAVAHEAAARCQGRPPRPVIRCTSAVSVRANKERLTSVIEHVIRNAQDATIESGSIEIEVAASGLNACLTVTDNGSGMTPDFLRDRLFRPFDSTKGAKGMGIGAYQVREYVQQLGGSVEVQSSPGHGTRFSITLVSVEPGLSPRAINAIERENS